MAQVRVAPANLDLALRRGSYGHQCVMLRPNVRQLPGMSKKDYASVQQEASGRQHGRCSCLKPSW